ncbi:hypothetical protein B0H34DRAFT_682655 [Crassisporium funariophilum]|nr:hypothetical protein B0H34DRAFT_682655 [Crassisporium funariophilum]
MSSRVQKGGPVFRPIVKSRSRTATSVSRQPSAALEQTRGDSQIDAPAVIAREFNATPAPSSTLLDSIEESYGSPTFPQPSFGSSASHPESSIMLDRINTAPDGNAVPSRNSLRPPVIGSSVKTRPTFATPTSYSNIEMRTHRVPNVVSSQLASTLSSNRTDVSVPNLPVPENSSRPELPQTRTQSPQTSTDLTRDEMEESNTVVLNLGVPDNTQAPILTMDSTTDVSTEQEAQHVVPSTSSGQRQKNQENSVNKSKKRRTGSRNDADGEDSQEGGSSKRSRASSGTPRPRKRAPSPPPYDPDADPGEDIDPTTITMAALCTDTGHGRVSRKAAEILNNHAAWKVKNREKRVRMKSLMEAKKYGREDEENENIQDGHGPEPSPEPETSANGATSAPLLDDTGSGFDYSQGMAASRYNVQVRIGPNGETIIDEESLVVDRVENDGTDNYTHITESDHTKFVNSGTYGKRYRGSRWSAEETELFYDALSQYGENYELIAYVLPGRDRKSCKNKFKAEDKKNHARINHCLDNSIPVDMKTLSRMTGKDFSGPVPEIRVPEPIPIVLPTEDNPPTHVDNTSHSRVKKRSRSKSQNVHESGVVVIGDTDNFENGL